MTGASSVSRVMATFIVVGERKGGTSAAEGTWVVGPLTTAGQFLMAFDTTTTWKLESHARQSQPIVSVLSLCVALFTGLSAFCVSFSSSYINTVILD